MQQLFSCFRFPSPEQELILKTNVESKGSELSQGHIKQIVAIVPKVCLRQRETWLDKGCYVLMWGSVGRDKGMIGEGGGFKKIY
jgi:hypothetical protein